MRIEELKIYTQKLEEQTEFYKNVLGLKLLGKSHDQVTFKMGESILKITYSATAQPYHFAINIPSNKELESLEWLKQRLDILKDGDSEIVDFVSWNAKAIYFYDADQNIVELIARKNLNNTSNVVFDQDSFLGISEIGVPTTNIEDKFTQLNTKCELEIFDGSFERFCAIGDENGLFISINKEIKKWFPTNELAYSSNFETIIMVKENRYKVDFKDDRLFVDSY